MKSAVYFMVIVLVLVAIGFVTFYIQSSDKVSELENQLTSAVSQVTSMTDQLNAANERVTTLEQENTDLKETITPSSPTHKLSSEEFNVSSTYWNMAFDDAELQQIAREVNTAYHEWHTYIVGETDCNDMAVDIWDMLKKKGVISLIAFGNLELENETFGECNHVWLVIFNSSGAAFPLEPTNGQLYFKGNPKTDQYMHFHLYAQPSDLRADLGDRW